MADAFPALPNPATGVGVASGLGSQLLSFLGNLPQQLMQWQQYRAGQADMAQKRLGMLSQLGTAIPGIASKPEFAQAIRQTFGQMGLGHLAPINTDGTVDINALGASPAQAWLRESSNYKQYLDTPTTERPALWNAQGFGGPAPDWFTNGPYKAVMPPAIEQYVAQIPTKVSTGGADPIAALHSLAGLRAGYGSSPEQLAIIDAQIAAIQETVTSPYYQNVLHMLAMKAKLSDAKYAEIVQQTATSATQADLNTAKIGLTQNQTVETKARTKLIGAQTKHTEFETNVLGPAQADNYRSLIGKRQVDENKALLEFHTMQQHGGLTPDKIHAYSKQVDTSLRQWSDDKAKAAAAANSIAASDPNTDFGAPITASDTPGVRDQKKAYQTFKKAYDTANAQLYHWGGVQKTLQNATNAPVSGQTPVGKYKDGRDVFQNPKGQYVFKDGSLVPGQ